MSIRNTLLIFLLLLLSCSTTEAATVDSDTGYSSFSATINNADKTITITETIISSRASFVVHFTDAEVEAGAPPWRMTRTITNGTGESWTYYDLELKVPCVVDDNTYQCLDSAYVQSTDGDGVSWATGVVGRVETSTAFPTTTFLEDALEGIRFSGGTVAPDGADTQDNDFQSTVSPQTCPQADVTRCVFDVQIVERPHIINPTCYDSVATAYNFEDISSTGVVAVGSGGATQARLGFLFDYYDYEIDSLPIASNMRRGYVDVFFTISNDIAGNVNLTTSPAPSSSNESAMVAAMWNAFTFTGSASGDVRQQQFGTAPNRYFILQWTNACTLGGSGCTDPVTHEANLATFQLKFFEIDDSIEVHLKDADTSNSSTIGLYEKDGDTNCTTAPTPSPCEFQCTTDGIPARCERVEQWSFNTAQNDETAIRFTRVNCPADDWGWTHRP